MLDINTPNGQESLRQEQTMLAAFEKKWNVKLLP